MPWLAGGILEGREVCRVGRAWGWPATCGPVLTLHLGRYMDQGSGQRFSYVATQGPLQSTVADFWRMVVETRVPYVM